MKQPPPQAKALDTIRSLAGNTYKGVSKMTNNFEIKNDLKKRQRTMTNVILFIMVFALIFSMGITGTLAATPATSIHVFGAASATTVTLQYDGSPIALVKQGNHWLTPDDGEYYTDDIDGIFVDGVWYSKDNLDIGVEASGTLNVWLVEPETYTIDTTVVNGTIDPDESGIPAGADRTINYSPSVGFHLESITVDGTPLTAGELVTFASSFDFLDIDMDHTIVVVYAADVVQEADFTILTSVVNGTIDPDEYNIPQGSDRTINYSPTLGFHLVSVTVDDTPVDIGTYPSSYSFTNIDSDHKVDVVYAADTQQEADFTILTSVVNGTIDPDEYNIPEGSDRTINYSPNTGFYLVSVKVDGVMVDPGTFPSSYDFLNIDSDHTIDVVYAENVVTDTNTSLLLMIGAGLLLAGAAAIVVAKRKKVTE